MFKLLLRHAALEKAIDVFFQKIFKNFPMNAKRYKKVFVKSVDNFDKLWVILYNVEMLLHPNEPEIYMVRFEYFKYSNSEYDWLNESISTKPLKSPKPDDWYEILKTNVIKTI